MPDTTPHHETRDVALRPLLWFAGSVTALIVVVAIGVDLVLTAPPGAGPQPETGQGPALQRDPAADLEALLAVQRARRDRLDWADREAGTAHVPVAVAMEIIARTGLPDRGGAGACTLPPRAPQCGEEAE